MLIQLIRFVEVSDHLGLRRLEQQLEKADLVEPQDSLVKATCHYSS